MFLKLPLQIFLAQLLAGHVRISLFHGHPYSPEAQRRKPLFYNHGQMLSIIHSVKRTRRSSNIKEVEFHLEIHMYAEKDWNGDDGVL